MENKKLKLINTIVNAISILNSFKDFEDLPEETIQELANSIEVLEEYLDVALIGRDLPSGMDTVHKIIENFTKVGAKKI